MENDSHYFSPVKRKKSGEEIGRKIECKMGMDEYVIKRLWWIHPARVYLFTHCCTWNIAQGYVNIEMGFLPLTVFGMPHFSKINSFYFHGQFPFFHIYNQDDYLPMGMINLVLLAEWLSIKELDTQKSLRLGYWKQRYKISYISCLIGIGIDYTFVTLCCATIKGLICNFLQDGNIISP